MCLSSLPSSFVPFLIPSCTFVLLVSRGLLVSVASHLTVEDCRRRVTAIVPDRGSRASRVSVRGVHRPSRPPSGGDWVHLPGIRDRRHMYKHTDWAGWWWVGFRESL